METITLNAKKRENKKASELRAEKFIPAEFYGAGKKNVSVQLPYEEFRKVYAKAGTSSIVDVVIEGGDTVKVLVHDVQYHPVRDTIEHVDLLGINLKEKITTHIPLTLEGTSAAVKTYGAILVSQLDELEVKCLPSALVSEIKVDISALEEVGSSIKVEDITIPAGLEVLTDMGAVIAQAQAQQEEIENDTSVLPEGVAEEKAAE